LHVNFPYPPVAIRAHVERYLGLYFESDEALAATSKSLAALAAAHASLAATKNQKDAPAFKLELSELVQNAQAIDSFYNSLSSKK